MVPTLFHCGLFGGYRGSKSSFDPFPALANWVETDHSPEGIIAEQRDDNNVLTRSRPVFPYPERAQYTGQGSIDDASNFVATPPLTPPHNVIHWLGDDLYGKLGPVERRGREIDTATHQLVRVGRLPDDRDPRLQARPVDAEVLGREVGEASGELLEESRNRRPWARARQTLGGFDGRWCRRARCASSTTPIPMPNQPRTPAGGALLAIRMRLEPASHPLPRIG
jgi:hypothetical protein